jgi:hypothetical protein
MNATPIARLCKDPFKKKKRNEGFCVMYTQHFVRARHTRASVIAVMQCTTN